MKILKIIKCSNNNKINKNKYFNNNNYNYSNKLNKYKVKINNKLFMLIIYVRKIHWMLKGKLIDIFINYVNKYKIYVNKYNIYLHILYIK